MTSPAVKAVARWVAIPTIVMIGVGAAIIHFTNEIEAQNLLKLTEINAMERELQDVDMRISQLEQEITVIRSLGARYDAIMAKGFAAQSSRLRAAQLLSELKSKYGLVSLTYDFGSKHAEEIAGREGTGFALVTNVVDMRVEGLTDTQILGFMAEFTRRLEGQVQVDAMSIRQVDGIADGLLDRVVAGERPAAFAADFTISWNNVTVMAGHDDVMSDAAAMLPVRPLQISNGMSDEDVMRIVARDNLMLTEREAAMIDAALLLASTGADALAVTSANPSDVLRDFRLDALLYFSPKRWSLWLNGRHVTPDTVPTDLRVNAINADYVELVWVPDAAQPHGRRIFTLKRHQIYLADTGEVLDISEPPYNGFPDAVESWADTVETDTTLEADRIARPEELTLTVEQVAQLRKLDDALRAHE